MHSHVCESIVLCNFITCADSCNHNYNQDKRLLHYHKGIPSCYSFMVTSTAHSCPCPLATTYLFSIYIFCHFRKVNNWNHNSIDLLRLAFSLSIKSLISIQDFVYINTFFLLSSIPWNGYTRVCLLITS